MPGSAAARSDRAKADGMARSSAPTSASPASVTLRIKTPLGCRKEARCCARLLLLVNLDNVRPGKLERRRVGDGCAAGEPLARIDGRLAVHRRLAGEQRHVL